MFFEYTRITLDFDDVVVVANVRYDLLLSRSQFFQANTSTRSKVYSAGNGISWNLISIQAGLTFVTDGCLNVFSPFLVDSSVNKFGVQMKVIIVSVGCVIDLVCSR